MKWELKTLEEVADFDLGKMLDQRKNKGDLRPYLANVNVRWGEFELGDLREMRFEPHELDRYGLEFGDIVMCEGGEPGRCAIWKNQLPQMMFQKALHRIRPRASIDHRFLYYSFLNRGKANGFDQYCTGSTIKHLPRQSLARVEVELPPLPTQQRIAAILSAYDDLIENNTRRIAILEEMARRLYDEWFVHFRFPGHEATEFVETSLGLTPRGWPLVRLEELVEINPRTRVPKDGQKPFVPMGSLSETSMVIEPVEQREGNSGTKFQNDDTLVARITPCLENGKTGFVDFLSNEEPVAFGSTEFIVLRPSILGRCAVYCLARSHAFRDVAIKSMSGAEGRQRVRPESIQSFPCARPPADLLNRFERFCNPVFAQVSALARKNANLRAQRDLLLPKLVSGEIDVSGAEAGLEAAE